MLLNKVVPPDNHYGTVELTEAGKTQLFYITEKHLSIETMQQTPLINLWVTTAHYEQIEGVDKPIMVPDIGFEVMLPVERAKAGYRAQLGIPTPAMQDLWERNYFSTFYYHEYIYLVNIELELQALENGIYQVSCKAYPSYDLEAVIDERHYLEASFQSELENTIKSRWNYNLKGG
jgi:hypothetical protein